MMKKLLEKYKSIIRYAFFGVMTTIVNVAVYSLFYEVLSIGNILSTVVSWGLAVAFAFVTNKLFVFESRSLKAKTVLKEVTNFILCRVGTGLVEVIMMYVFVDILSYNGTIMKLLTNIIVIILNYVASKLIIFQRSPK
jgi:hypothetical protein